MCGVRVSELDELLIELISRSDHPEIVAVERTATEDRPNYHVRVVVRYASGGSSTIMVHHVVKADGRSMPDYTVPDEVL
jgi:type IV secretory pathway ATPase VirB11/archaellum biosynthesis ATPase